MTRNVYTVDLSPRENLHRESSITQDVWDVLAVAALAFLVLVLVVLVMA